MNYNKEDIIKFKNGEYLVLNVINNNNDTYLYLINNDEYENDISVVKVEKDNNNNAVYSSINNDQEFEFVLNKIFLEYENDIVEFSTIE